MAWVKICFNYSHYHSCSCCLGSWVSLQPQQLQLHFCKGGKDLTDSLKPEDKNPFANKYKNESENSLFDFIL